MKVCGIYGIVNTINNKIYIGKSVDIKHRFSEHKCDLKGHRHFNLHLQNSFNKYGEKAFEYIVIETCEKEHLADKEQNWIDFYEKIGIYNSQKFVKNLQSIRNPFFGKKHTLKTKKKMSKAKQGMFLGNKNPNWGGKNKEKLRSIMLGSKNKNAKLNEEQVLKIIQLLKEGCKHQDIANQFKIARTVITRISNGTRWSHITRGAIIPVIYKKGIRIISDNHRKNKLKGAI